MAVASHSPTRFRVCRSYAYLAFVTNPEAVVTSVLRRASNVSSLLVDWLTGVVMVVYFIVVVLCMVSGGVPDPRRAFASPV